MPSDTRCLVEARPGGDRPRSARARADTLPAAIALALLKIRRSLTSFFGEKGRTTKAAAPKARATPVRDSAARSVAPLKATKAAKAAKPAKKVAKAVTSSAPPRATPEAKGRRAGKATAAVEPTCRRPKKTPIFQARRTSWPSRSR